MTPKERVNAAFDKANATYDLFAEMEEAIQAAVEEEREACAKLVDHDHPVARVCAQAIRARGGEMKPMDDLVAFDLWWDQEDPSATGARSLAEMAWMQASDRGRKAWLEEGFAQGRKAGIEEAREVALKWAEHYPTDIFPEDGTSIDCKAARMARLTCGNIATAIEALAQSGEAEK